jgi:endonuclease III related protein
MLHEPTRSGNRLANQMKNPGRRTSHSTTAGGVARPQARRQATVRVPRTDWTFRCRQLRNAYDLMLARFGHQRWWPGETPFEVCVGAILTQNTAWTNVERAIARLKEAGVLDPRRLYALPPDDVARLIRPAGYFNVKTRRLRSFLVVLVERYDADVARMLAGRGDQVRERLLAISGIGPETADSMLLYAGGHRRFVVDAYTRRIFARHSWCHDQAGYDELQRLCETALARPSGVGLVDYWGDYHAQLVAVGKDYCRPGQPRCEACPLKPLLPPRRGSRRATAGGDAGRR